MLLKQECFPKNLEKLVKSLYQKKYRYKHGLCIVEGFRACHELYLSKKELIVFGLARKEVDTSSFVTPKIYEIHTHVLEKLSSEVNNQGLLFVVKIPEKPKFTIFNSEFALVLDRVSDPGNLGTILRTCAAVGLKQLFCSSNSVDLYSEKTIRSAISAQFTLDVFIYDDLLNLLDALKEKDYQHTYRTDPSQGKNYFKEENLFSKSVIVFGNEAHGLGKIEHSIPVNIPMPGNFESLNLAQSVTLVLYEDVRRKMCR